MERPRSKQRRSQIRNRKLYNRKQRIKGRSSANKYIKANYRYKDPKPDWADKEI